MTGYGRAQGVAGNKKITVEVKSVNSKGLDLNTKLPTLYREKDIAIRKIVGKNVGRGKVECAIFYDGLSEDSTVTFNRELIANYVRELNTIQSEHNIQTQDPLAVLMRMPDVYKTERQELGKEEWGVIQTLLQEALSNFNDFRAEEGAALSKDFSIRVEAIEALLDKVVPFEKDRIDLIREKFRTGLEEIMNKQDLDEGRFEQELIYYIEKYDITEEKVRLTNHCAYFRETLHQGDGQGKKLGFIAQEMGREINTIGSKANHAEIQKLVVQMKDELEKIKEQVLNVL